MKFEDTVVRWAIVVTILWVLLSMSGILQGSAAIGGDPTEPLDITQMK